jgi:Zn-dependent protease
MSWSFKLGRMFGIDVRVHVTFFLLLAYVGLRQGFEEKSLGAALDGMLFLGLLFGCVVLHEFGHSLMARRYGIATRDITLLPIGGVARLERMPDKPWQELWVALAGPAVNVLIAIGLGLGLWVSGGSFSLEDESGGLAGELLMVNLFLLGFNLLPAFPMDGGRVLRALLAMRLPYARATRIAAIVGQGMAVLFGLAGVFMNPMLILIAVFVWAGAAREAAATRMKSALDGIPVRAAMRIDFRALEPANTLGEASRLLLLGAQQDFPIIVGGEVVGVLTRESLLAGLQQEGEARPVEVFMTRNYTAVEQDSPLEEALPLFSRHQTRLVPVVSRGLLVGLLTANQVQDFALLQTALSTRPAIP